jgi:Cap4 dsDNA endonuclease
MGSGDQTGSDTLSRYIYQCKVAVIRWLGTLWLTNSAQVLCEYLDDITLDTGDHIEFAQVKTRDRGAWTAADVLSKGGGLDALVRSFNTAVHAGVSNCVRLELVLEGHASAAAETRTLFADPTMASMKQRASLIALGLNSSELDRFLAVLTITASYYSRHTIDAVSIRLLGSIVPAHFDVVEQLYEQLLRRAIDAHLGGAAIAEATPWSIRERQSPSARTAPHALTRTELVSTIPPNLALADEQRRLLEAASEGSRTMSLLEFKLRVAGASDPTVQRAKLRRAEASIALETRGGLTDGADEAFDSLVARALDHAEAVTTEIEAIATTAKFRPADVVFSRLVQQRAVLGALDHERVLGADGGLVLGLVCELSDRCLFAWRSP